MSKITILVIVLGSILLLAVICAVLIYILRQLKEKSEAQELARRLSLQNKYWEALVEQQRRTVDENRVFRHDTRHHIATAIGLISSGDPEKAAEYLSRYRDAMKPMGLTKWCDNSTVACVLSYFAGMAEDDGIEVNISANLPSDIGIDDTELGGLFSNLFENAVESCHRMPSGKKRYINLHCSFENNKLLIATENSCCDNVTFHNDLPVSQKKNGGLGTKSIIHTAEKYRGLADFSCADGVFYAKVILISGKLAAAKENDK